MTVEQLVEKIPSSSFEATSERLIDMLLNSPNAKKMPSDMAKAILYYWQRDQLVTKIGLKQLLEASMIVDSETTVEVLKELGFQELVTMLESR